MNIIFILSDDQGSWAMGCNGNEDIITPNIDKLANEGMKFDNFFCTSPVCSPARASLFTGRIPSQHGVHDWLRTDNKAQEDIEYLKGQTTYTDILKENGYICGLSGKWHLGKPSVPQKGFDHWFCHQAGGSPYYGAPMYRDGKLYNEPRYLTDVITEDAIDFIENNNGDKPFYLHIGYTAPHSPWINNHPKEIVDLYKNCEFKSCPEEPVHPDSISLNKDIEENRTENLMGFHAATTAMDIGIGKIIDKVEELGIREDTMIIFASDNGFNCGHHGIWGKGNGTFPINMYDTSVKVPFIVSHTGSIPKNKTINSLVSAYDFMPTILDYLGIDYDIDEKLPGKSFAKALRGEEFIQEENIVVMDEYGPNRMIRTKDYKYIKRYPYGPDEMYNLKDDPDERVNLLINDYNSDKAIELRNDLANWFKKYVNPDIDGAKEAVVGSGQINLAGQWANGKQSHSCEDYISKSEKYKFYKLK